MIRILNLILIVILIGINFVKNEKQKVIFISGKITNDENYIKKFKNKQIELERMGYIVLNPCEIAPVNISYDVQIEICLNLIDMSDKVYFLEDWQWSNGSCIEHEHCLRTHKKRMYENEHHIVELDELNYCSCGMLIKYPDIYKYCPGCGGLIQNVKKD